MTRVSGSVFRRAVEELGAVAGEPLQAETIRFRARGTSMDSPFRAAEAAGAALAAGGRLAGELAVRRGGAAGDVCLDSRHAEGSLLSFAYLRFEDPGRGIAPRIAGEDRTAAAGFYPAADGRWIYLHSGFPHNTRGLLELLGVADDRAAVARAVAARPAAELEQDIGDAGLCGAMVRSAAEWDDSDAGRLLGSRPVVEVIQTGDSDPEPFPTDGGRPLDGIKVLDLTRILAGPTCARTLASYGANALRVGAAHLPSVPLFTVDTGFGKRACDLDLRRREDVTRLRRLVKQTDVFSQGYRSGAMERLGFGVGPVTEARPGIVYVSINCYGHEGLWRPRPGWEQLAQTVTGMAERQGRHLGVDSPTLLPAAVNDYTTGYLAAFGALVALKRRAELGGSYWVRVSLARTAMWVRSLGERRSVNAKPLTSTDLRAFSNRMDTHWGPVSYLAPAVSLSNTAVGWRRAPSPLGSDPPRFG
jgi:crotonobetainyl-CoA:carnitine CoA-transferase CaiB-like acyl-CoA transferase